MKNLQTMKQGVQKGFTLIELMIVVAIIGILAAIAIPAYTDYTIKSRVAEGASLSGAAKTAIEVYWSENGTMDSQINVGSTITSQDLNFTGAEGEYVSSVSVIDGPLIEVRYHTETAKLGSAADGSNTGGADNGCLQYVPEREAGRNITWKVVGCDANGVAPKYLPKT